MAASFDKAAAQETLLQEIANLFNNPDSYADLLVKCGKFEWLCQKAIVCPRSTWFRDACALQDTEYERGLSVVHVPETKMVMQRAIYLMLHF